MTFDSPAQTETSTDSPGDVETAADGRKVKNTSSLCPECLKRIDAVVYERDGEVWLEKRCDAHGRFSALLSSDSRHYYESALESGFGGSCCSGSCAASADASARDAATPAPNTAFRNHSCTVLIEITERCNLSCPTCFAGSSPQHTKMMSLDTFTDRLDGLVAGGKSSADMIQLSGGEPTVHPGLFDMLDRLFTRGFNKVTINSNGIKLAQRSYVERLADCRRGHPEAGLFVYLQFDGFEEASLLQLRGRGDLLDIKRRAIANCIDAGITVHPVMTLTRGINDHEVGDFVSLALDNPEIGHVVIQPAMYSGRYDNPRRADRLTVAGTADLIVAQFGVFSTDDFGPIPCSDPNCHSVAVALRTDSGLVPVSRFFPRYETWDSDEARELVAAFTDSLDGPGGFSAAIRWATSDERVAPVFDELDDADVDGLLDTLAEMQADGGNFWDRMLTISIKPFMDAWTYDQDRIDKCCVHILDDDGSPVSFCEFNAIRRPLATLGRGNDA